MKIVAIVQARMGSTRLPGKVLKKIVGIPALEILLARLSRSELISEICVATSHNTENDQLCNEIEKIGYRVIRGSETDVLARLETKDGLPVNILASVGGIQPDRQEFIIKGTKQSRKVEEFHKDSLSTGNDFIPLRDKNEDPRAVSLKSQLDDLYLKINNKPNRLATIDEAFRVQKIVEEILSKT